MLENGSFLGAAVKEMKEELGIQINEEEMIDLIELAYKG